MLIDFRKLDLYLQLKYNVLFAGRPGVGKTSIIYEAAKRKGLKVKYFSAPTMDPWVDLVGVPKNVMVDVNGKQIETLDLIPPKDFVVNKYDMIFIDEFNRAPPKVTNALMELMQFKTINGRPLDISMVWAAINPFTEEGDFHVEQLDPAVEDRFHIRVDLPYSVDKQLMKKKHGVIGSVFVEWWDNQPQAVQHSVSPRRLETAIEFYQAGGTLTDMIKQGNITDLTNKIKGASEMIAFEKALEDKNEAGLTKILSRNISPSLEKVIKDSVIFPKVFPFISEEWLSAQVLNYKKDSFVFNQVEEMSKNGNSKATSLLSEICKTNMNSQFVLSNFSKIQHTLPKEVISGIEEQKQAYEDSKSEIFSNELLLRKSAAEANFFKDFIPDLNNKSMFSSSALNNFYPMHKFNSFFEEYHNIPTSKLDSNGNTKYGVNVSDSQEKLKSQLAFCIATSLLMLDAIGSSGTVYNRLQQVLRANNGMHVSYIFNKNIAKGKFDDMESRIQTYMEKFAEISPSPMNEDSIQKIFKFATDTRTRNNMEDPFTPLPASSSGKVKKMR